jgi:hypothetical protein
MDISGILQQIESTVLGILQNPLLADGAIVLFLLIMGLSGIKKGYWFGLWNLFLSLVSILVIVTLFLDTVASIIEPTVSDYLTFGSVNLTKTFAMFLVLTAMLLLGSFIFGFIYILFTPIKGKNYSYRDFDPMVVLKVKGIGFTVGLLEGLMYVLFFNVVMQSLATYTPQIFTNLYVSTLIETLHPDNSILLSTINGLFDYSAFFNL